MFDSDPHAELNVSNAVSKELDALPAEVMTSVGREKARSKVAASKALGDKGLSESIPSLWRQEKSKDSPQSDPAVLSPPPFCGPFSG